MRLLVVMVLAASALAACGADALRRAPCVGRGVRINPVERPIERPINRPQSAVRPSRVVDAPGGSSRRSSP